MASFLCVQTLPWNMARRALEMFSLLYILVADCDARLRALNDAMANELVFGRS